MKFRPPTTSGTENVVVFRTSTRRKKSSGSSKQLIAFVQRPRTYAALLSLLFATGLRISEALRLRFDDITADGLLIRETKFRKTRLVPLHDSAIAGLRQYLLARRQTGAADDHVFVDNDGRPLRYVNVQSTFLTLLKWADLWPTSGHHRRPRLHDACHTFAVKALQACPAGRARIGKHMVALATYLGHVNIHATYWYLDAAPENATRSAGQVGISTSWKACRNC
jgi:integrase/recombinase XerD